MKRILLLLYFIARSLIVDAQPDTSAYEAQRSKINSLLAERSVRFGQYEQSLSDRSGIFGFQTKNDIRNSNEILRQIALKDNNIFKELKILLDYKDLQYQQVQTAASVNSERLQSYMAAIKKLQDQNQRLRKQLEEKEKEGGGSSYMLLILLVLLITAAGYFAYYRISLSKKLH
jgi:hypothetical protein